MSTARPGRSPQDGPSSGIAQAIALISLFSGRAVPPTMAMTVSRTVLPLPAPFSSLLPRSPDLFPHLPPFVSSTPFFSCRSCLLPYPSSPLSHLCHPNLTSVSTVPYAGTARLTPRLSSFHNTQGEISLRGRITAVGGIKEKLIGALRAGVKTVLLPAQNRKDVKDLPQEVKDGLEIVHVRYVLPKADS